MIQNNASTSTFILSDVLDFEQHFTDLTEIKTEGFNRLFKAKRFGKWFLLKGLKSEYASQALYRELLRKEFEISISLEHPNIVHTIGFEQVDQVGHCIVFEYLEGATLKTYLKTKHSVQERKRIADELITALTYVHEKQIVHRDLKPENIIITTNGHHLKLIDFGLADADSYAILKQPAGTEKYIAPEQKTASSADCRNDIYSLGKILIEINPGITYQRIARRCLAPIDQRYPSAKALGKRIIFVKQILKAGSYLVLSIIVLLIVSSILFIFVPTKDNFHATSLDETISYGKERIDKINQPLKSYIDTLSVFNEAAYICNQQLVDTREKELETLLDSLTSTYKESDKAIIRNALNTYIEQTAPHF